MEKPARSLLPEAVPGHQGWAGCPPHLADPTEEGLLGKTGRPVHGLAIILGAPAGTVDVDVVGVQAQRARLHGVCHFTVQHAHPWPQRGSGRGLLCGPGCQVPPESTPSPAPEDGQGRRGAGAGKP